MTAKEVAEKCKCSVSLVYVVAKQLGRLPTEEEINARKGKNGRPLKYKAKE